MRNIATSWPPLRTSKGAGIELDNGSSGQQKEGDSAKAEAGGIKERPSSRPQVALSSCPLVSPPIPRQSGSPWLALSLLHSSFFLSFSPLPFPSFLFRFPAFLSFSFSPPFSLLPGCFAGPSGYYVHRRRRYLARLITPFFGLVGDVVRLNIPPQC